MLSIRSRRRPTLTAALPAVLTGLVVSGPAPASRRSPRRRATAKVWVTTPDGTQRSLPRPVRPSGPAAPTS